MGAIIEQDEHRILAAMKADGFYVDGIHVVYKANTHGEKYLDKDAHLQQPGVAQRIAELLAQGIKQGSLIIAPETSSRIKLVDMVGKIAGCRVIPTQKKSDTHTIDDQYIPLMQQGHPLILADDIFNNGVTLKQIRAFLEAKGIKIDEFHAMVNRNPRLSHGLDIPLTALATTQMDQWDESKVSDALKKKEITTKLGNARNWVPKDKGAADEPELPLDMFLQRKHKQDLGFIFDDGKEVVQMDVDEFFLSKRKD